MTKYDMNRQKIILPGFPLSLAAAGERVLIKEIKGGTRFKQRLSSMGIQLMDNIEVIQSGEKCAVLIAKEGNRFMLGGGMARKIYVIRE